MRDIQGDHLGRLVRRTLDKTGRKRLRIGTFVRGSGIMSLGRPPRPDRDRLRSVADSLIHKEILEVGAHRPVGHAKSPRDLFIGQPGCRQVQNLRLPWRYARAAATPGELVTAGIVAILPPVTHGPITRCLRFARIRYHG